MPVLESIHVNAASYVLSESKQLGEIIIILDLCIRS